MSPKIAKFECISAQQWDKDIKGAEITELTLPQRATKGSAGYDIMALFTIDLAPKEALKIPTGLKCKIDDGWFLGIFPKSGLGFKYHARLGNSVGIIDQDYSLNAGRYVGVVIEDDGLTQEEFKEEMLSLNTEFTSLSAEARDLEELIANNLKGLLGE